MEREQSSVVPDLSHAGVVSFVRVKALVDLFRQSGVLLWAPTTQEQQSHGSGENSRATHTPHAPGASILAVTDCGILLERVAQRCNLLRQALHHFVLCLVWL